MSATIFAAPSRLSASNDKTLVSGAAAAFALHACAITAMLLAVRSPVVAPAVPIMVSMIIAPVPEPLRPEPQEIPRPRPVIKKPVPVQKTLLVAEKPAAEIAEAAPTPPPPPAPAAPAAEPAPVAVIPPRVDASYLDNPRPIYPSMAKRRGVEGKVVLRVFVNTDGTAGKVELNKTSGDASLDQSALDAVKRWRFIPAKLGNQAIGDWFLIPIIFTLGA